MADAPPKAGILFSGHTSSAFLERGDWEGVWKGQRSAGSGFEEELVGYTAMLVFVTSPLANALDTIVLASAIVISRA